MKKALVLLALFVLAFSAYAKENNNNGIGSPDDECQDFGFDFGIAKWEFNEGWAPEGDAKGTLVTGTDNVATYTGNADTEGVIIKAGNDVHYAINGVQGTVEQYRPALSHITFCGNNDEVPEFTFGTAAFVAAAGLLGTVLLFRK